MRLRLSVLLSASLLATSAVHATPIDNGAIVDKDEQRFTVNADGTWNMERQLEYRIKDARLIRTLAQQSFTYNATLESLDVVEAYTEKPDGSRIAVTPDRIREQQEAASPEVAMFQDERVKVAIFPQVQAGDRLVVHLRQRQTTPLMTGQFQDLSWPGPYPVRQARIVYDMPAAMPLYADARGYRSTTVAADAGRRRYQFDYVDHPREMPEVGGVSPFDGGDRLVVSTMADYAALAAVYQRGMAGKTGVTPAVRALQQRITAGIEGQRAQALALGNWVRKNVRYVAVYVGAGGMVPHSADEVLAARYGDCKDHEVLLEALLDAAGIPNTAALISAGNAYQLPTVAAIGVLNHVINYLPGLDLFIDSTADDVAAGYLPAGDLDKTVVLTRTGTTMRTPVSQPKAIALDATFVLGKQGVQSYTLIRTLRGAAAEAGRVYNRNTRNEAGQGGVLDAGDIDGSGDEYLTRTTQRVTSTSADPKKLMLNLGALLSDELFQRVMARDVALFSIGHAQDYPCDSDDIEQTMHVPIPAGFQPATLPQPLELHAPQFDYVSQVARTQDEIVIKRRYHAYPRTNVCTPADARARAELLGKIVGDLNAILMFTAD